MASVVEVENWYFLLPHILQKVHGSYYYHKNKWQKGFSSVRNQPAIGQAEKLKIKHTAF